MSIIFKGSPNFSQDRKPITHIVIHWFGIGTLASANARFQNASERSSAHYGISNDRIWQWVEEKHVAWHAGKYSMNQKSIGIEHDATLTKNASEATYQTSGKLISEICKRYNIPIDRKYIILHKEVSPTRCPGTIDINKLINIARGGGKIVFKEKTKIPIGGKWGEMELQALVSTLNDQKRDIENLVKEITKLNKEIVSLEKQTQSKGFTNKIADLFYQLALAFENRTG